MPIILDQAPLIKIDENVKIWRYLSFDKFESLLRDKSLFFCRADKFSDPFEGSLPKKEIENRLRAIRQTALGTNYQFEEKDIFGHAETLSAHHKILKSRFVINCWHINLGESDAMWRLYLKDNEGVAIQSTPKKLFKSLENSLEKIHPSKIRYLNYDTDLWYDSIDYPYKNYNFFVPLIHKRMEFVHESEFRLLIDVSNSQDWEHNWENEPIHIGRLVTTNVVDLVEKIILSPTCDEITKAKIIDLANKYHYKFSFEDSKLKEDPLY